MTIEDIVRLVPEDEPKKSGSYKKKEAESSAFFIGCIFVEMGAKIFLTIITAFLFVTSIYLIVTNKKINGFYLDQTEGSGFGWVHNSFSGLLLLAVAIGFLIATIYVFKGKKIKP